MNDFEKELNRIRERNRIKGIPVQPFPLVVGPTLNSIHSSYFVIDGVPLILETPLRALEVTFKSYHAFHSSYPLQSSRVWIVLQEALFGVEINTNEELVIARRPEVNRLTKILKV